MKQQLYASSHTNVWFIAAIVKRNSTGRNPLFFLAVYFYKVKINLL